MKIYEYDLIDKRLRLKKKEIFVEDIVLLDNKDLYFNLNSKIFENIIPGSVVNMLDKEEIVVFFSLKRLNGKEVSMIEKMLKGNR